eukprot:3171418-Pleurochrysis_carterae.AAC.1
MPRRVPRHQHDLLPLHSCSSVRRGGGDGAFPQSGSEAGLAARGGAGRAPLWAVKDVRELRGGQGYKV